MIAKVKIDPGICGFPTKVVATSEDNQFVRFDIKSNCEKVRDLANTLHENGDIDAFREINPADESIILACAKSTLVGCCAGCAVASGIMKATQVATGLALPKDVNITVAKE